MNSRTLSVCFVSAVVLILVRMAGGQAYPTVGTIDVGYGVPGTSDADTDSHGSPFMLTGGGDFLGDENGNLISIGTGLTESPSNTIFTLDVQSTRLGAVVGTRSYGDVTQYIFVNSPVIYTLSGALNFTSPGVDFSTDLHSADTTFSEQYDLSNANAAPGGTVTIGPLSGELAAGDSVQWDWSLQNIADAVADNGSAVSGNMELSFTVVPEPTIFAGLLCGMLLIRRRCLRQNSIGTPLHCLEIP